MPAPAGVRPRERLMAFAAVALVQLGLGIALLRGLQVDVSHPGDAVARLIDIALQKPPPPPPPPPPRPVQPKRTHSAASAPKAAPKPLGGSPGPKPAHAPPSVTPVVAVRPTAAPSGGGRGSGPALGSGAGGGSGGNGYGAGDEDGGTDSELIGGDITWSDYPRELASRGIGGRVGMAVDIGTNGRVTRCTVTHSSGIPELDALTCRLVQQRYRFRPATDEHGRPVPDQADIDHVWTARGG